MYVKKLDIDLVEDETQEIVESASKIREMEEELEDVMESLERNHRDYKAGRIPQTAYKINEKRFLSDKAKLSKDIKSSVKECLSCVNTVKVATQPHLVLKTNGFGRATKIKGR